MSEALSGVTQLKIGDILFKQTYFKVILPKNYHVILIATYKNGQVNREASGKVVLVIIISATNKMNIRLAKCDLY